jgi:hypothetical protein
VNLNRRAAKTLCVFDGQRHPLASSDSGWITGETLRIAADSVNSKMRPLHVRSFENGFRAQTATELQVAYVTATLYISAVGAGSVFALVPCIGFVGS